MPRDIPINVPNEIRALIESKWGDIASFARSLGPEFDYTSVHSMLVRSGGRESLRTTRVLANTLGCSRDEAAQIFFVSAGDERKAMLTQMAQKANLTLIQLSENCWGNRSQIYKIIKGTSSGKRLRKLVALINHLGLDQDSFERLYDGVFEAA